MLSRRCCDDGGFIAGVHENEAAGAVGAFRHARRETSLAEERSLLIASDPRDRDLGAEQRGGCANAAGIDHAREQHARDPPQRQQLLVPTAGADVVEHRTRRVGRIRGVHVAAGEFPDQPAVDRTEGQLATLGALTRASNVVEQPGQLGSREVRVDHEPGFLTDQGLGAGAARLVTDLNGAPILPHQRVGDWPARGPLPHQRRFALIGNTDGGDIARRDTGHLDRGTRDFDLGFPDLFGIVLDPAGAWENLLELPLHDTEDGGIFGEYDGARAGRSLIERNEVRHTLIDGLVRYPG